MSHRYHVAVTIRVAALLVLSAQALPALAGVYRCYNGSTTYLSDRPCSSNANKAEEKFTAMGPRGGVDNPPRIQTPNLPSVGKAPEHLRYMSTACAQINDAIRTAPARGLRYDTINQLRSEYQNKCGEEEGDAYRALSNARAQERQERRSEMQAQQARKDNDQRERERCNEMLRILHNKRGQFDSMSEGQKTDFVNFQSNYNARCRNE